MDVFMSVPGFSGPASHIYAQTCKSPAKRWQAANGMEPILTYDEGGRQPILLHFSDSRNKCCFLSNVHRNNDSRASALVISICMLGILIVENPTRLKQR